MAVDSAQEQHRPGSLKQQNKAHKHGRHKSKGSLETLKKGMYTYTCYNGCMNNGTKVYYIR